MQRAMATEQAGKEREKTRASRLVFPSEGGGTDSTAATKAEPSTERYVCGLQSITNALVLAITGHEDSFVTGQLG